MDDDFSKMNFEEPPDYDQFVAGAVPGLEEPNFHNEEPDFLQNQGETKMTEEESKKVVDMQALIQEQLKKMGIDTMSAAAIQNAAVAPAAAAAAAAAGAAALHGKPEASPAGRLTDFVKKPGFNLPSDSSQGETLDSVEKAFSEFTQETLSLKYLALTQSWMQKFNVKTTDAAFGQFMSLIYVMNFLDKYPEKIALVLEKCKQETVDFVREESIKKIEADLLPRLYSSLIQRAESNVNKATKFISGAWILLYLAIGGFVGNSAPTFKITSTVWSLFTK